MSAVSSACPIGAWWIRRGSTNFAECTGDHQWIHVDPERAKRESPYRAAIAHGYLTLSLIGSLSQEIGVVPSDAAAGFNYGLDKVRFSLRFPPARACGSEFSLVSVDEKSEGNVVLKTNNVLEIENSEKPALVAEALALLIPARKAK